MWDSDEEHGSSSVEEKENTRKSSSTFPLSKYNSARRKSRSRETRNNKLENPRMLVPTAVDVEQKNTTTGKEECKIHDCSFLKLLKTWDSRRRNWVVSEWVAKEGGKRQQQQKKKSWTRQKEEEKKPLKWCKTQKHSTERIKEWHEVLSILNFNPSLVLFNSSSSHASFAWFSVCFPSFRRRRFALHHPPNKAEELVK